MALDFTITDAGNNGGVTVTVTGSTAGTTNSAYGFDPTTNLWLLLGTRVGDGAIAGAMPYAGLFWFRFDSSVDGSGPVKPGVLTRSSEAVWVTILNAVVADVTTLALGGFLPGIDGTDDVERLTTLKAIASSKAGAPCIYVVGGDAEAPRFETSGQDDIEYPVLLAYRDEGEDTADDADYDNLYLARERLRRRYIGQRLVGYQRAQNCEVTPMTAKQFREMGYDNVHSAQMLRFKVRESRGVF